MTQSFEDLPQESECDVLVVGAGMVGASAALGLSSLGFDVKMIDAFAFSSQLPDYTPSYDSRSTALSWGTREILEQLGVWGRVEEHACPITQVHVSEKGRFGTTRMRADDYGQEALGYVVPNQCLGQSLLEKVYTDNIAFYSAVKMSGLEQGVERHRVELCATEGGDSRKHVAARLVLIVDGTESKSAKLLGIEYQSEAYSQHALVVNVSTSQANEGVAFERFTKKGPLAMLPLDEHNCALVWTHDDAEIQSYLEMSDTDFCRALEDSFSERLGTIDRCGKRIAYPLKLVRASEQCRSGVLVLGNAAHSLHPVAGQGFNLAIRGVASFLAYMKESQKSGQDYRALKALNSFCQARIDDQIKTIAMSDQLVKIFASQSMLLSIARDLGLIGMDNVAPLKSAFAQRAMGLADRKAHFAS